MRIELPNIIDLENVLFQTANLRFGTLARKTGELATAIKELSDYYLADPDSRGTCPDSPAHQAARMMFFTLADLPKAFVAAAELDTLGQFPGAQSLNILDLGVGYGAQSLGLLAYLSYRPTPTPPRRGENVPEPLSQFPSWEGQGVGISSPGTDRTIHLEVVDRDEQGLEACDQVFRNCQRSKLFGNLDYILRGGDLERAFTPKGKYDIILLGNTLCELSQSVQYPLVDKLLSALTEAGVLIIIEPALKATSRNLHQLRDTLLARQHATILAPCTRPGNCPCLLNPQDWCHEARPYLLPPQCRHLAAATGLRMSELKWSYLTITKPQTPNAKYAPAWRVVSDLQKLKGKHEVFLCGEPGRLRTILQKRDKTAANETFKKLHRGQFVWLQHASIRNDYLLLDKESSVVIEDPYDR